MVKFLIPILIIVVLTSCAGYKTRDKILTATFITAQSVDLLQTVEIFDNPRYYELNPMITSKSSAVVWKSFGTIVILTAAKLIPEYRTLILSASNVIVWGFVAHNHSIGIRIDF